MKILDKLKAKFLGKTPNGVVADETPDRLQYKEEVVDRIVFEERQARVFDDAVLAGRIAQLVPEPKYQRTTTASRRLLQVWLDSQRRVNPQPAYPNRAARRFRCSPYGRKMAAQEMHARQAHLQTA